MQNKTNRRTFLKNAAGFTLAAQITGCARSPKKAPNALNPKTSGRETYKNPISLAQWSLHRAHFSKEISPMNFPGICAEKYELHACEYVNTFYKSLNINDKLFNQLRRQADNAGVTNLLIMVDGEGALGDPNPSARGRAVGNHQKWLEMAQALGCHSIRVNAQSQGPHQLQMKLASEGLSALCDDAKKYNLNILVENHGGLSSNGAWLASVIRNTKRENAGTLPDFGNFQIGENQWYDRYKGVQELMPYAKAVSAKSHSFDNNGEEKNTDYGQMMKLIQKANYKGFIGIEYEGSGLPEHEGILMTKKLLLRHGCKA